MNILIIGSGGREHALTLALDKAKRHTLYALPGNPGMAEVASLIPGSVLDRDLLQEVITDKEIDLVVFGQEGPLSLGFADTVRQMGVFAFGPGKDGALLETSKAYAKQFMKKYRIATAEYEVVSSFEEMMELQSWPVVIKADGLAGGKGVFIPQSRAEYESVARELFQEKSLGSSADKVVIEERLEGEEISFFYVANGKESFYLGSARDHKRAFDEDLGPNTGGMGAFSPVELTDKDRQEIELIAKNTLIGLQAEGIDYRGVLFIGCMRTSSGLKVLEYNVRFGDPETQALQAQWGRDFDKLILASAKGEAFPSVSISDQPTVCVVVCSKGYPGELLLHQPIELGSFSQSKLFHAGTKLINGVLENSSGRVFNLVSQAETIEQARQNVYDEIKQIHFLGSWYRKDIARENNQKSK